MKVFGIKLRIDWDEEEGLRIRTKGGVPKQVVEIVKGQLKKGVDSLLDLECETTEGSTHRKKKLRHKDRS